MRIGHLALATSLSLSEDDEFDRVFAAVFRQPTMSIFPILQRLSRKSFLVRPSVGKNIGVSTQGPVIIASECDIGKWVALKKVFALHGCRSPKIA